jgi:hypothetical protein
VPSCAFEAELVDLKDFCVVIHPGLLRCNITSGEIGGMVWTALP